MTSQQNYQCAFQDEVQSQYFCRNEVSIHVSILYRHSLSEYDGEESTAENPIIVREHIFTILDDLLHDSYAVQHIRTLIHNYLTNEIKYPVKFLHEFTDGCGTQYKSKPCMGSHVLLSNKDFGYFTKRNYFETSHAKGEQDAAGAHIKQRAAMAVVHNEVTMQSGKDLFEFLSSKFSKPIGENAELKCRKFFYVDQGEIVRKGRKFTDVSEDRKNHCVTSNLDSSCLLTNTRSCYCQNCL